MQNTKLIKILRTFSTREIKDFEKFMSSPYFLKKRNPMPLWKVLKKFYPDFKSPKFTKEKIFNKIYPGKKINGKTVHAFTVAISEITSLACQFLAIERLKRNYNSYKINDYLLYEMFDRELYNLSLETARRNRVNIEKINDFKEYCYEKLELLTMTSNSTIKLDRPHETISLFEQQPLYAAGYYFINISGLINYFHVHNISYNANLKGLEFLENQINNFDIDLFIKDCYDDGKGTKQIIMLNYYICKVILNKEDLNNLSVAFEIYCKYFGKYDQETLFHLFLLLHNACLMNLAKTLNKTFGYKAIEICKYVLERGIYSEKKGKKMNTMIFISIMQTFLSFCSYEETKDYIEKNVSNVAESSRKWIRSFALAMLEFRSKNYEKALEYTSKLNLLETLQKETIYKVKAISLYETGHYEEAKSVIESYIYFLRHNKNISGIIKSQGIWFYYLFRQIFKARFDKIPARPVLYKPINAVGREGIFSEWIYRQCNELQIEIPKKNNR